MYLDVVFPSKNEKKFIEIAFRLGYDGLCLVYSPQNFSLKKIEELQLTTPIKLYAGLITQKTKKPTESQLIFSESKNEKIDRKLIEQNNTNIIFNFENQKGADFIHQRNSGLNQVLCKIASNNHKTIGISFSNLLINKFNPKTIGRICQNFSLCKKYNTKIIFASFTKNPTELRSPTDLRSFLLSIGVENQMAKESLLNLSLLIELNKKHIFKGVGLE